MYKHISCEIACEYALSCLSAAYLVFAYIVVEYRLPYVPVCPFLFISGIPCPLCGSTRAIGGYLHGEFVVDWHAMPSIIWLSFIISIAVVSAIRVISRLLNQGRHSDLPHAAK